MKLSIITVNFNNLRGLYYTIESVINQTFIDYEYIIIDGGSTDGSVDVIKKYEDKITYWVSEPDRGIYNAMNKGILHTNGEYLMFLNSGDWLVDENILLKVFASKSNADILYGDIFEVNQTGSQKLRQSLPSELITLASFNSNKGATIQHPASFIRRSLFENNLYDESYSIVADIKFWIERIILQNLSVEYIQLVITNFSLDGISSNPTYYSKTIKERSRIFKELLPPRILKDYAVLFEIKDSPLLKYIPLLEKTTGLNKLVTKIVGNIVDFYKIVKRQN